MTLVRASRLWQREGMEFPKKPPFAPITGNDARQKLFGPMKYTPAPIPGMPEAITVDPKWRKECIVEVFLPQIIGIRGAPRNGKVLVHRKIERQFMAVWGGWEMDGLTSLIQSFDGSWVPRFVRGSTTTLSNHSFGTAWDVNASTNGLGTKGAQPNQKGCLWPLVKIANECGFYWGGHYGAIDQADGSQKYAAGARPDAMHFEIAQLMEL